MYFAVAIMLQSPSASSSSSAAVTACFRRRLRLAWLLGPETACTQNSFDPLMLDKKIYPPARSMAVATLFFPALQLLSLVSSLWLRLTAFDALLHLCRSQAQSVPRGSLCLSMQHAHPPGWVFCPETSYGQRWASSCSSPSRLLVSNPTSTLTNHSYTSSASSKPRICLSSSALKIL